MTEGNKLQLIHPPNPLQMKVGISGLGAPSRGLGARGGRHRQSVGR